MTTEQKDENKTQIFFKRSSRLSEINCLTVRNIIHKRYKFQIAVVLSRLIDANTLNNKQRILVRGNVCNSLCQEAIIAFTAQALPVKKKRLVQDYSLPVNS